jgi:EmrB/QacA subfamily drug resistance transporter
MLRLPPCHDVGYRDCMSVPFGLGCQPAIDQPSARGILAGLSLVMLMPSLDTSIANASLPVLAAAFGASFPQVQWIVLSYLLAITTLIVSAGRLGDMIGRRTLLLAAIVVFTVASLMCGLASSLWMLLGARTAQGVGAGAMMALAIALIGDTVPAEKTGSAMGWLGSMSAIGTALGPSLGALLAANFGWPAIFLVNVPFGVAAFELVRHYVAADQRNRQIQAQRFDIAGTCLLALTLGAYALSATLRPTSFGAINAALVVTSLLAGGAFYLVERRTEFPLIRLAMMRDRVVSSGLVMSALVSAVMMTTLVVGPFYLSRVLGLSGMAAGLVLSVGPVVAALTGVPAGRFVDRIGAHRMMVVGLLGIAGGAIGLIVVPSTLGIGGYVGPIALMTSSYASFQAANNTAIMSGVRAEHRGVVAGLLSLSRNLGLITGAAVLGAVFANSVASNDPTTAAPEAVAAGMRVTFAVAALVIGSALVAASPLRGARHSRFGREVSRQGRQLTALPVDRPPASPLHAALDGAHRRDGQHWDGAGDHQHHHQRRDSRAEHR